MMILVGIVLSICMVAKVSATQLSNFEVWCEGNCDTDKIPSSTTPGVVLMGGGTDTNEAFLWQITNANGGDFVVLRAAGDDAYNPYIFNLSMATPNKLNSVRTILTKNRRASSEPEVLEYLKNAEAIFFAGGDQSDYLDFWADTEIQGIVQSKISSVTIGGTSAGCMILGNWIYTSDKGSIISEEALADPYDRTLTIGGRFLKIPYLETILADTHFVTRDRMGRSLTFNARIMKDVESSVPSVARALGVDEHTALLLNTANGDVQTVGVGTAYVCESHASPAVCKEKTPLTYTKLQCTRLSAKANDAFSFASWTGPNTVAYDSSIVDGKFTNLPYGPV